MTIGIIGVYEMTYELLKENARSNRKNMTEAESIFWSVVKKNALGERCLRQHIVGANNRILTGLYFEAADINSNKIVDIIDLAKMRRLLVGLE